MTFRFIKLAHALTGTSSNPISKRHSKAPAKGSSFDSTTGLLRRIFLYFCSFGFLIILLANFSRMSLAFKKSVTEFSLTSFATEVLTGAMLIGAL